MKTASTCVGEPISWLRLEQYHLGELDEATQKNVAQHLEACPACTSELRRIAREASAELAPLPAVVATKVVPLSRPAREPLAARFGRAAPVLAAFALAAAIFFVVGRLPSTEDGEGDGERIKGNDISVSLVRERDGLVGEAGGSFDPEDRWKVLVTCPPGMNAHWDVVVFDADGASFPMDDVRALACGNEIGLPGAFRLTGYAAQTVCLVWNTDRGDLRKLSPERLPRARCETLQPSR